MTISKKAAVSISALSLAVGLGIGFGVSSCAGPVATPSTSTSPTAVPSSPETGVQGGLKTQEDAKKTVDAFFKQISTDLPVYEKQLLGKSTDAEMDAVFAESFKSSSGYLKEGAFSPEQAKELISSFAQLYIYDREAKIESKESSYELGGDTATIKGTDFIITIDDKVQEQQLEPGKEAGKMTLIFEGDKWLISGFDTGGH